MNFQLNTFSNIVKQQVDTKLSELLPDLSNDTKVTTGKDPLPEAGLIRAMRYSALGGGKRVRPLLCFASAQLIQQSSHKDVLQDKAVLSAACAIELIHAYSLVHDDLPAMDDDDLRRGRPTTHKKFDEATAILAGDALQTLAFSVLTEIGSISDRSLIKAIALLAGASGMSGMAGGQMIDISVVGDKVGLNELAQMHSMKTGALIKASVLLGAIISGCEDQKQLDALSQYAEKIGLAFQIQDDILDCTTSTEVLGKQQGADAERGKPTYVSLLGLDGARTKLAQAHSEALASLTNFEDNSFLSQMADYIVARAN